MAIESGDGQLQRPSTWFAPPQRARGEVLRRQIGLAAADPVVDAMLRSLGGMMMVLNRERQVVAANTAYLDLLGVRRPSDVLGHRPGESIGCVHAEEHPAGCGTAEACASCGAAIAILLCQERGTPAERECVVTVRRDGGTTDIDLRVRAAPLDLSEEEFVLFTLSDVSEEKRRAALERAFFRDVADVVAGLTAATVDLPPDGPPQLRAATGDIRLLTARLAREVQAQRALLDAGGGGYRPELLPVQIADIIEEVRSAMQEHPSAAGKVLRPPPGGLGAMETDPHLVERVLCAMVQNALEATVRGGEVRLSVDELPASVTFGVWNAGAVAGSIAPHVFQRYFSTRAGAGRGQGTYSMKLFGERVLGGQVGFTTSSSGTLFTLRLPRRPQAAPEGDRGPGQAGP